jgi:hypothetical protein
MDMQQASFAPDGSGESGALLASFWTMPFNYMRMMHDLQVEAMHAWARALWSHGPHHAHEAPNQLEIPDPIAEALEQDLFA